MVEIKILIKKLVKEISCFRGGKKNRLRMLTNITAAAEYSHNPLSITSPTSYCIHSPVSVRMQCKAPVAHII